MFDAPEHFARLAASLGSVGGRMDLTILVLVGALLLRWVAKRTFRRRFGEARARTEGGLAEAGLGDRYGAYRLRKIARYLIWSLAGLLLVLAWTEFGRRLGLTVGLFSAVLAFALQNVLGSFAAWIGILVGKVFRVGDQAMMGGVKAGVIDLSPLRTTVMEIGSPGAGEDSDVWVRARQYPGRVVTVSNKTVFAEPLYNYSQASTTSGRRSPSHWRTPRVGNEGRRSSWRRSKGPRAISERQAPRPWRIELTVASDGEERQVTVELGERG